jgi:arsenate reductase (glutaredoxin)
MLKVYSYPKCSTCLKALKFLRDKKVSFELIDITLQPPTLNELQLMLESYEGNIKKLFNTSGVAYRELNIKDQINDLKPMEALKLLNKNGRLIKRPFAVSGNKNFVGFDIKLWGQLI